MGLATSGARWDGEYMLYGKFLAQAIGRKLLQFRPSICVH